jgi:acylglycerol lipase
MTVVIDFRVGSAVGPLRDARPCRAGVPLSQRGRFPIATPSEDSTRSDVVPEARLSDSINAAAPSAPVQEEDFSSLGGVRIHLRSWVPAGTPRGVVVICHGVNSHGGQHGWTAEQLAAQGFAVYALDLRGRGVSEGERFYVDDVAEYVADLRGAVGIARERHPGVPLFVLGHSAGGVVSCTFALDHQAEIDGLMCESFAFQVPAPGFVLSAIKGLSHVTPRLGVLTLHMKDFTRDPVALAALEADPLTKGETQPAATVAALVRADERLHDCFGQITLPVLILHGTEDRATVCRGSEYFHANAGSADKTLRLYEGHYHDLLNDIGKEAVLADIVDWLEARLRAA